MTESKQAGVGKYAAIFNMVSGVCSLCTLSAVLIGGGKYIEKVDTVVEAVKDIQIHGTPTMREHERKDDERVDDIKRRLNKVEDAVAMVANQSARLAVMDERLDTFAKRMVQMQDQINAMLKTKL